jgi:hypothetical protein
MAKTLVGVLAVSITAMLFTGCGGTTPVESSTSTTAAKTVVDTFCGDRSAPIARDQFSKDETIYLADIEEAAGLEYGVIALVWSDGTITWIKATCIRWVNPGGPFDFDLSRYGLN